MRNAEKAGLTTTKPEKTFEEMLKAIGDSLSDLASSNDEEAGEDEDDNEDNHAGGKLCEDIESSWVMGTICQRVQYLTGRFWQKEIKLGKLMQPGWGELADCFRERDKKYGVTE